MTEAPLVSRAGGLETLIIKWRAFATGKVVSGDDYYDGQRSGIAKCADQLEAALSALPSAAWQPMDTMPEEGQVIVCWKIRAGYGPEYDTIGRGEYLEIMGYGETPALGWMPLPAPPTETPHDAPTD